MILKINGHDITPDPSDMSVTIQDISTADSGRSNTSGIMYKSVVSSKRVIDAQWNNIDRADAQQIISYLKSGTDPVYPSVTYDGDPEASGTVTKSFYYGDISSKLQQVWTGTGKMYSLFSIKLIEK